MALKDAINKIFHRGTPETDAQNTSTGYINKVQSAVNSVSELWKTLDDRRSIWIDIEKMDGDDEIVSGSLDVIADKATAFVDNQERDGFYIESSHPEIKEILNRFISRTKVNSQSWDIVRATVKHGSNFCELVIAEEDKKLCITQVKQFPRCYQISRNEDDYGKLLTGDATKANQKKLSQFAPYEQIDDTRKFLAAFYEWQIVHFKYGRQQGMPYPTPYFASARKNWKRLQILEDGMAMARLLRAYMKIVHEVLIPLNSSPAEQDRLVNQYKDKISKKPIVNWNSNSSTVLDTAQNPHYVDTDIYAGAWVTADGKKISPDIRTLDASNPQLQNLADIKYQLNRLISRTKVPAKYLNIDVGQPKFSEQGIGPEEEHFGIVLKKMQLSHKDGIKEMCDLELILNGVQPKDGLYTIIMPESSIRNSSRMAQVEESYSRAASMWSASAINDGKEVPWEFMGSRFLRLSGEELDGFVAKMSATAPAQAKEVYRRFGGVAIGDHSDRPLGNENGVSEQDFVSFMQEVELKIDDLENAIAEATKNGEL